MKKVVFCVPTVTRPYQQCLNSIEACLPAVEAAGWEHAMVNEVGNPYISAARATMLRKALDAGATAIVFIDHDVSWRAQDMVKLLDTEGEVVAGTYRFKADQVSFMGTIYTDAEGFPALRADGAIKAKTVPAGFLKFTPAAVERFMTAYPHLCYGEKYHQSVDIFNHGAHEGLWWGEDYAFSRNFIAAGGTIWLIPDLQLDHHGKDVSYIGNFHEYLMACPGGSKDPARAA